MLITFIFIACLLTGLGVFDNLVQKGKMGLIIPITGFAHSMQSAMLDYKKEGLIYGFGHAVYSISDPRAQIFRQYVEKLAAAKGEQETYDLYSRVERLAPLVIAEKRHIYKGVSTNVDFYSGLVYDMLGLPVELYTPIFAIARIVGWSAHRLEELINMDKIIRPAYVSISDRAEYVPMQDRI